MTVFADKIFPVPMGIAVEEHYDKDGKYTGCRVFVGNSPEPAGAGRHRRRRQGRQALPAADRLRRRRLRPRRPRHGPRASTASSTSPTATAAARSSPTSRSGSRTSTWSTRAGRHVKSDQLANTLRVNRDGTEFEVICDRQRNNYETSAERLRQHLHQRQRRRRQPRLPRHLGDGRRPLRLPDPRQPPALGRGRARQRRPSSSAPATAARAGSWSTRARLLPEAYFGRSARGRRRHPSGQLLPDHPQGRRVPHRLQGASWPATTPGSARSTPAPPPTARSSWPTGTTPASAATPSATRRPAGSTGSLRRGAKPRRAKPDFGSIAGLIEALKSPNIATHDAARRGLIARGDEALGSPAQADPPGDARRGRPGDLDGLGHAGFAGPGHDRRRRWSSTPRRSTTATPGSASWPSASSAATAARTGPSSTQNPDAKKPAAALANLDLLAAAGRRPRPGRPPRADPGPPQPADRPGRRRPAEARRLVGRPGPLVP